jgi:hypothetical protein
MGGTNEITSQLRSAWLKRPSEPIAGSLLALDAATSVRRRTQRPNDDSGLDPHHNPAITVLHFADVLQKFTAAAMIRTGDADRGIRDCLHAGKQCSGCAISVKKRAGHREGDFWLDSLNFKREATTEGWSVEALLVFVDDKLVYELIGGQPTIHEYEVRRNPLGPLQAWAEHRP